MLVLPLISSSYGPMFIRHVADGRSENSRYSIYNHPGTATSKPRSLALLGTWKSARAEIIGLLHNRKTDKKTDLGYLRSGFQSFHAVHAGTWRRISKNSMYFKTRLRMHCILASCLRWCTVIYRFFGPMPIIQLCVIQPMSLYGATATETDYWQWGYDVME